MNSMCFLIVENGVWMGMGNVVWGGGGVIICILYIYKFEYM